MRINTCMRPFLARAQRLLRAGHDETAVQRNAPWNPDRQYTYPNNAANVRAYVLDSGIRITHNEFEGRASHSFDFGLRLDSGTSMATPAVAGAAAVYLSTHPGANNLRGLQAGSPNRLLRIRQ